MIYTGYFAKLNTYTKNGLIPVSICGKCPPWYNGIEYKKLAPKYFWWKEWHDNHLSNEWYIDKYNSTVLATINPQEVLDYCNKLGNVVLLCYEKPGDFCHRNLVAKWLNEKLNIDVKEYKE